MHGRTELSAQRRDSGIKTKVGIHWRGCAGGRCQHGRTETSARRRDRVVPPYGREKDRGCGGKRGCQQRRTETSAPTKIRCRENGESENGGQRTKKEGDGRMEMEKLQLTRGVRMGK